MPEILYTVEEAAKRLKMHPDTLRRQLRQGRIKSVRTGKLWRIPESVFSATAENLNLGNLDLTPPQIPEFSEPGEDANETDLEALFTVPTPEEIAKRLEAWENFGGAAIRSANAQPLTDDAVAQGYDERAAQMMEGHR